ncbi:MAG: hypothetical protein Q9186_005679 [Xanthomendoza sp. 1 TL-2023]
MNKTTPLNFLGVDCYHLDPQVDSISLLDCQTLFAWMTTSAGGFYEPHSLWNGWRIKRPGLDPCLITLESPVRRDLMVRISFANILSAAHEILEKCQTGGANIFQGEWRVVVKKRSSTTATMMNSSKLQLPASCDPPGPQNPPKQLVWVIFGATGHIGRAVAKAALSHNDIVTAVGRSYEDTMQSIYDSFRAFPHHALPLLCDVRVRSTVEAVIQQSIVHWGRIDIIANCTGYGVIGACEDQDDYDIRNQFETNFFGTLNILHASLPYFRTRQQYPSIAIKQEPSEEGSSIKSPDDDSQTPGGRYLIFSSTTGVPGLGPYSATKHAVEGLIESMLYETHAFNIKATLVEPGFIRRDDLDPENDTSSLDAASRIQFRSRDIDKPFSHFHLKPIPPHSPYNTPTAPASHPRRVLQWLSPSSSSASTSAHPPLSHPSYHQPHQPTSTLRSAELIYQLAHCTHPPLRLLLGAFVVESVRDRLRCVIEEIEEWRWLGFGEEVDEEGEEGEDVKVEDDGEDGEEEEEEEDGVMDGRSVR